MSTKIEDLTSTGEATEEHAAEIVRKGPAALAVERAKAEAEARDEALVEAGMEATGLPPYLPVDLTISTVAEVVFGVNREFERNDSTPRRITVQLPYVGQESVRFQQMRNQIQAFSFRDNEALCEYLLSLRGRQWKPTFRAGDFVYLTGVLSQNSSVKDGESKPTNWPAQIHLTDITKVSAEFAENCTRFSQAG